MKNLVLALALVALAGVVFAQYNSSDSCCCSSGFIMLSLVGAVLMAKR
jgi:ABC-type uncharacterized transport system permease subunit